ncbi:MAG: glutamate synthase subunit alpha, partial [Chloroflexota bacterium]|nr:glutamate synthase subunit alpha [Chloroflexota bacterium]
MVSQPTQQSSTEPARAHGLYDPQFEHDACGVAFVADIQGRRSHEILQQALQALENLQHRGACGCDPDTGDGAGVLLQIPHAFLSSECAALGFHLPAPGEYAVGAVFLPREPEAAERCQVLLAQVIERTGMSVLGWRDVPQDNSPIGPTARSTEPRMRQVFVGRAPDVASETHFERRLYLARRRVEKLVAASDLPGRDMFYVASLSCRTLVYKGMLSADQIPTYFPDLVHPEVETGLAVVHQRFSTNTFPTWSLAHPFRYLAHNGEINTKRGNINWMRARQEELESDLFGDELQDLLPVIADEDGSDSAVLDNVLEMLVMTGRSLPHAMMMLIPEPWSGDEGMNEMQRAFYNYHSSLLEPWDGPAAVTFTDGIVVGAMLDRNGLRPGRYYVTRDGRVVMASEVGVLDIPPADIVTKGRLEPGKILFVDTAQGRIVPDSELKNAIAAEQPYGRWLAEQRVPLESLPPVPNVPGPDHDTLLRRQLTFGLTLEEMSLLIAPMATEGQEAVGSMGTDTPLAVLSQRPQLLYNYFKQLFAQVTNPPIDPIREELVMGLEDYIGRDGNL